MIQKKQIIFIIAALIAFLSLRPVLERIFGGEEARLKRIIYSAKRATEKEDFLRCISYVSFDYRDSYGNDRHSLLYILKHFLVNMIR